MGNQPVIITFAGVVGSSKTPIASWLSWNLALPLYNNDAVRSEVQEDLFRADETEHRRRRDERIKLIVERRADFICDASMDREWVNVKPRLIEAGYRWFIINLNLSQDFLIKLYTAKNYSESRQRLDQLLQEHEAFVQKFQSDIGLTITDREFPRRLEVSLSAVKGWLGR